MKFIKNLPWGKLFWLFIAFLFTIFMAWSVLYETLLPLWSAGDTIGFQRNLIGIPILFLGIGLFCYSAFRFLRDTFSATQNPDHNPARGKSNQSQKIPRLTPLIRAWLPSFFIFLASVALIAMGGNLTR